MECKQCGGPINANNAIGICTVNATCRSVRRRTVRSDAPPCKSCGEPTRSSVGYCNRYADCHARAVGLLAAGPPCILCGGPTSHKTKYGYCYKTERCRRACQAASKRAFLANNAGYEAEARYRSRARRALNGAQKRALQEGIPFTLTEASLPPIPAVCPVFGLPFHVPDGTSKGGPHPNSLTLDKIVPELGYVSGNVRWLSHRANAMKRDATPKELLQFADWIYATLIRPRMPSGE